MMCKCDEYIGRTFLPHQLSEACELHTQKRIPVDLGFQANVCQKCRDIPETAYPKAEIYGRTSKILRYYWREIEFETLMRMDKWAEENKIPKENLLFTHSDIRKTIHDEVVEYYKTLHKRNPKYKYTEISQQQIIEKYNVEVVSLKAEIIPPKEKKVILNYHGKELTAEEFVKEYYASLGYSSFETESIPFHVLFAVFLWMVIQDPRDPELRYSMFGSRTAFDQKQSGHIIKTFLPSDFGTQGYGIRRKEAIDKHFWDLPMKTSELLWIFDYWLPHSSDLREYLWAQREKHIEIAKKLLNILSTATLYKILRYLLDNYWDRYLGWPDMIIYNENEYFFAEVKASKDRLSEVQKGWIKDNAEILKLPFKLIKIHNSIELLNNLKCFKVRIND